jgi:hypothetical protein
LVIPIAGLPRLLDAPGGVDRAPAIVDAGLSLMRLSGNWVWTRNGATNDEK